MASIGISLDDREEPSADPPDVVADEQLLATMHPAVIAAVQRC